jgi:hypothetical protein
VSLDDIGRGVCLSSNVARAFSIDSRGMLMGSARTVHVRSGAAHDSAVVSIVGRLTRSD